MSDQLLRASESRAGRDAMGARPQLLTRRFLALLVAQSSFGYAFSSFFLLPKYLADELAVGPAAIGSLNAAHSASAVAGLLVMGVVVDRFGRRRFLTAGGLLMAAASLAFVTTHEFGAGLYALRIVQGFAFSMAFVAGAALTVDQAPPERLGQALGLFGVSMLAMNALAPLAVETVAARSGWGPAFATAAGGALLCAFLSRFLHEQAHEHSTDSAIRSLLQVARRPEQIRAAAVIALVGSCFGSLFVFGQLHAIQVGLREVHTLFTAYAIAALTVRVGFGQLGDRLGRIRVSAAALLVYAAGAFAMPELGRIGLAPIGAVFGLAHGLFYPTYNASIVDGAPADERGKIVALFQGWFNVGTGVGSFTLGLVAERSGYPAVFFVSGAGILLALAILLAGTRPATRRGHARINRAAPGRTP